MQSRVAANYLPWVTADDNERRGQHDASILGEARRTRRWTAAQAAGGGLAPLLRLSECLLRSVAVAMKQIYEADQQRHAIKINTLTSYQYHPIVPVTGAELPALSRYPQIR